MGFSPARLEAIENGDHLVIVELMEILLSRGDVRDRQRRSP